MGNYNWDLSDFYDRTFSGAVFFAFIGSKSSYYSGFSFRGVLVYYNLTESDFTGFPMITSLYDVALSLDGSAANFGTILPFEERQTMLFFSVGAFYCRINFLVFADDMIYFCAEG